MGLLLVPNVHELSLGLIMMFPILSCYDVDMNSHAWQIFSKPIYVFVT